MTNRISWSIFNLWWFCVNNKANPVAMIVGDSFANHLYPIFTNDSRFKEYGALMIGACSFIDVGSVDFSFVKNHPCLKDNYYSQIEFIKSVIRNEKSLKILIIAGLEKTPDSNYFKKLQERI